MFYSESLGRAEAPSKPEADSKPKQNEVLDYNSNFSSYEYNGNYNFLTMSQHASSTSSQQEQDALDLSKSDNGIHYAFSKKTVNV